MVNIWWITHGVPFSVIKEKVEARSGFVLRGGTSVRCNEKLIPQFILLVTLPRREGWTVVIS